MFYSAAFITLLIEGINWYHQHYSDTLNNWPSPVPDITKCEMLLFLVIIIPLVQDIQGCLKDYWKGLNSSWHHFTASKTMIHDSVLHIIGYLHFLISDNVTDNNDPNYDLWWKNKMYFWDDEWHLLKLLHTYCTSDCGRSPSTFHSNF